MYHDNYACGDGLWGDLMMRLLFMVNVLIDCQFCKSLIQFSGKWCTIVDILDYIEDECTAMGVKIQLFLCYLNC